MFNKERVAKRGALELQDIVKKVYESLIVCESINIIKTL
jgi:hypothetical protein